MHTSRLVLAVVLLSLAAVPAAAGEFVRPWKDGNNALVVDGYVFTKFDWSKLRQNKQLVGFINKASDGLITSAACGRGSASERRLCWAKWRRYVATRELFETRKVLARELGFKWGSYHLARPGNPRQQALHYLRYAKPADDELMALDIEDNNPKWMSLPDAEIFAKVIEKRTGRLPVLYTNHSTAKAIAAKAESLPTLSRMNLWYARYKRDVRGAFPMGRWESYAMWQFAAKVNCRRRSCPLRLKGTDSWVDINVVNMTPDELRRAWPFSEPYRIRDLPQRRGVERPLPRLDGGPKPEVMVNVRGSNRRIAIPTRAMRPDGKGTVSVAAIARNAIDFASKRVLPEITKVAWSGKVSAEVRQQPPTLTYRAATRSDFEQVLRRDSIGTLSDNGLLAYDRFAR